MIPATLPLATGARAVARSGDHEETTGVIHELKSWPELFEPTTLGIKTHDLRRADDRTFQIGDRLRLREFDPKTERYTDRECMVEVTYVTSADVPCSYFDTALHPRYCILSIRLV